MHYFCGIGACLVSGKVGTDQPMQIQCWCNTAAELKLGYMARSSYAIWLGCESYNYSKALVYTYETQCDHEITNQLHLSSNAELMQQHTQIKKFWPAWKHGLILKPERFLFINSDFIVFLWVLVCVLPRLFSNVDFC